MPIMPRKEGKITKIVENILGTPPNKHKAYVNTPRIREADVQRVVLMLGQGGMPDLSNQQMPQ